MGENIIQASNTPAALVSGTKPHPPFSPDPTSIIYDETSHGHLAQNPNSSKTSSEKQNKSPRPTKSKMETQKIADKKELLRQAGTLLISTGTTELSDSQNLRRSKRARIPPADFWRNEVPIYELDENGQQILVGIQAGYQCGTDAPHLIRGTPSQLNHKRPKKRAKKKNNERQHFATPKTKELKMFTDNKKRKRKITKKKSIKKAPSTRVSSILEGELEKSKNNEDNQDISNEKKRKVNQSQNKEIEVQGLEEEVLDQAEHPAFEDPSSQIHSNEAFAAPRNSLPKKNADRLNKDESFSVVVNTSFSHLRHCPSEIFRLYKALKWINPCPEKSQSPYRVAKSLIHDTLSLGVLELGPHEGKPPQHLPSESLIYLIESGSIQAQVDNMQFNKLGPMDTFIVPAGSSYALKNLTEKEAILFFIIIKEPEP